MTATLVPNGVAPGFIYRRQWIWIEYPEPLPESGPRSPEAAKDAPEPDGAPARLVFRPNPDYGPHVDADGTRHPGFAVRVAVNPNGAELRHEGDLWAALEASKRDDDLDAYLQAVAWRVREWRAHAEDDDGGVTPIPAPGECPDNPDQWQAFYAIPNDLMYWVIGQIRIAHLLRPAVPKVTAARMETPPTTSSTPVGTTATPTPSTSDPASERPTS